MDIDKKRKLFIKKKKSSNFLLTFWNFRFLLIIITLQHSILQKNCHLITLFQFILILLCQKNSMFAIYTTHTKKFNHDVIHKIIELHYFLAHFNIWYLVLPHLLLLHFHKIRYHRRILLSKLFSTLRVWLQLIFYDISTWDTLHILVDTPPCHHLLNYCW